MVDIIQFTTVHTRHDARIRYKQCETLAELFPNRVALFVQDGLGDEIDQASGLKIFNVGYKLKSRFARFIVGNWRMYRAVRNAMPKIAHFHDPELILTGLFLKVSGIKVVYDIHEDVPQQILSKTYVRPFWLRPILAYFFEALENIAVKTLDLSIAAVPNIANRFPPEKVIVVRNLPRIDLLQASQSMKNTNGSFIISYAGSLSESRGIVDLVKAMEQLPEHFELHLFGTWQPGSLFEHCKLQPGWRRCTYHGRVPHAQIGVHMGQAHLGVHMVHDVSNYRGGLATKIFEYLALGVPTLMSDTQERRNTYRDLTEYARPQDPVALAKKIEYISSNYADYAKKAEEQKGFVFENFSWTAEASVLHSAYSKLLGKP